MRFRWFTCVLPILIASAAACGGGTSSTAPSAASGSPASPSPVVATSPPASAAPEASATAGPGSVEAAIAWWRERDAHVTYRWQKTGEEPDSGTFELFWQPGRQRWAVDIRPTAGDGGVLIALPDRWLGCSHTDRRCISVPVGLGSGAPLPFVPFPSMIWLPDYLEQTLAGALTGIDVRPSTRQVAGIATSCWEVEDRTTGQQAAACFSPDGFLLYARTASSESTFEVEATSFDERVGDDSFAPPYPIQSLPIPGQLPSLPAPSGG